MEREIVRITEEFKGVRFSNFPWYRDGETGELTCRILDGVMCEDIAEQIPPRIRGATTVDFASLDYETLLTQTKDMHGIERTMSDEEVHAIEKHLIDVIFRSSDGQ